MELPIVYTENEYNPSLGLYQKWLHGNPEQQIEKMYSMSAFQFYTKKTGFVEQYEYQKYAHYLDVSIMSIINNTKEWYVRIYIDESVLSDSNPDSKIWKTKLEKFKTLSRVQIICVKFPRYYIEESNNHQGLLAVMFRYLTLFDPNVSIVLFRDVDNVWTEQHHYFVDTWLERKDNVCLFLNEHYKRQQVSDLTPTDVILEDKYYITLLSGLWNIRKDFGFQFPYSMWQKIFAYIESYTDFVFNPDYKDYKFYGIRFEYGFDELALSRVVLPNFIEMGLTFYAIPIKIYDVEIFNNLFDNPLLKKFINNVAEPSTQEIVKKIMIENYWSMHTSNAGLSQYILCILTNIYFNIIVGKNKFYKSESFVNGLKDRVYTSPLLMSLGLFTFKNFEKYNWYNTDSKTGGNEIVKKFTTTNKRITLEEFTAYSDLSNSGNGPIIPDIPIDPYGI